MESLSTGFILKSLALSSSHPCGEYLLLTLYCFLCNVHVFVLIHLCILSANHMCACATKISSISYCDDDFEEIGYDDQIWSAGGGFGVIFR